MVLVPLGLVPVQLVFGFWMILLVLLGLALIRWLNHSR
ncbi:uncharacterized protein METZ01_LOCUS173893, partial [marine metagenome]